MCKVLINLKQNCSKNFATQNYLYFVHRRTDNHTPVYPGKYSFSLTRYYFFQYGLFMVQNISMAICFKYTMSKVQIVLVTSCSQCQLSELSRLQVVLHTNFFQYKLSKAHILLSTTFSWLTLAKCCLCAKLSQLEVVLDTNFTRYKSSKVHVLQGTSYLTHSHTMTPFDASRKQAF